MPEASAANSDIRGALAEFRRKYGTAGLFELLEQLAFDIRCGARRQKQGEFPVNIGRLAKSHSDKSTHVDEITRMRGERILMQFALFAQKSTRTIDFAHPIIADYLAGKYVLRELKRSVTDVCALLDHNEPDDAQMFLVL